MRGKVFTMCIRGLICEPGRRQRLKRLRRHSRSSAHFSSPLHIFPMVRQVHRVLLELWDQLWSNSYSKRLVLYLPSCSSFRVNGFSSASFFVLMIRTMHFFFFQFSKQNHKNIFHSSMACWIGTLYRFWSKLMSLAMLLLLLWWY